jgi:hypothetical protein
MPPHPASYWPSQMPGPARSLESRYGPKPRVEEQTLRSITFENSNHCQGCSNGCVSGQCDHELVTNPLGRIGYATAPLGFGPKFRNVRSSAISSIVSFLSRRIQIFERLFSFRIRAVFRKFHRFVHDGLHFLCRLIPRLRKFVTLLL